MGEEWTLVRHISHSSSHSLVSKLCFNLPHCKVLLHLFYNYTTFKSTQTLRKQKPKTHAFDVDLEEGANSGVKSVKVFSSLPAVLSTLAFSI